jgi:threonine synthase
VPVGAGRRARPAAAHAYFAQPGIQVVILYPRGRISPLQENLFCTLGGTVRTVAVELSALG